MNATALATILDAPSYTSPKPLTASEEAATIRDAQQGNRGAHGRLLALYGGFLRAALADVIRRQGAHSDRDEARSLVLLAYVEALTAAARAGDRLASHFPSALYLATDSYGLARPSAIPPRTARKVAAVLREYEGDIDRARHALAAMPTSRCRMAPATFDAAIAAYWPADIADEAERATHYSHDPYTVADARLDVARGLTVLDERAHDVIRIAYGLDGRGHRNDVEVARTIGISRPRVQAHRARGLDAMRDALGITAPATPVS